MFSIKNYTLNALNLTLKKEIELISHSVKDKIVLKLGILYLLYGTVDVKNGKAVDVGVFMGDTAVILLVKGIEKIIALSSPEFCSK